MLSLLHRIGFVLGLLGIAGSVAALVWNSSAGCACGVGVAGLGLAFMMLDDFGVCSLASCGSAC